MKSLIKIEVGWSYPGSPNAERFGFNKTGCWTVSEIWRSEVGRAMPPKEIAGFATKGEAISHAAKLSPSPELVAF